MTQEIYIKELPADSERYFAKSDSEEIVRHRQASSSHNQETVTLSNKTPHPPLFHQIIQRLLYHFLRFELEMGLKAFLQTFII